MSKAVSRRRKRKSLGARVALLKEQAKGREDSLEAAIETAGRAGETIDALAAENAALKSRLEASEIERQSGAAAVADVRRKLADALTSHSEQFGKWTNEHVALDAEIEALKAESEALKARCDSADLAVAAANQAADQRAQELREQCAASRGELAKTQKRLFESDQEIAALKHALADSSAQLARAEGYIDRVKDLDPPEAVRRGPDLAAEASAETIFPGRDQYEAQRRAHWTDFGRRAGG